MTQQNLPMYFAHPGLYVKSFVARAATSPFRMQGVFVNQLVRKGSLMYVHTDTPYKVRTRESMQVGPREHIEGYWLSYTNHSCAPSGTVRLIRHRDGAVSAAFYAVTDIAKNNQFTFDYAGTEVSVTNALQGKPCLCGAATCRGYVSGFRGLRKADKAALIASGNISTFIKDRYC